MLRALVGYFSYQFVAAQGTETAPHTVYGIGFKGRSAQEMRPWRNRFEEVFRGVMPHRLPNDLKGFLERKRCVVDALGSLAPIRIIFGGAIVTYVIGSGFTVWQPVLCEVPCG